MPEEVAMTTSLYAATASAERNPFENSRLGFVAEMEELADVLLAV